MWIVSPKMSRKLLFPIPPRVIYPWFCSSEDSCSTSKLQTIPLLELLSALLLSLFLTESLIVPLSHDSNRDVLQILKSHFTGFRELTRSGNHSLGTEL